MKKYRFHWLTGRVEEGMGLDATDALRRLGYGGGIARTLDWWEEVK